MASAMVRISEQTHEALREISRAEQKPMQAILEKAVEQYRRALLFQELDAAYTELRKDPEAWAEIEAERSLWDRTLGDGLPDERWGEDGAPEIRKK